MEVYMNRISARFALNLLLLTLMASLAIAANEGSPYLRIESVAPEFTQIRWENPVYDIQSLQTDGEVMSMVELPGERLIVDEGNPAIPHVTRLYRIPNTGSVELVINSAEYRTESNYFPVPAIDEQYKGWRRPERNAEIYDVDSWYPPVVAEMSEPMIFRDFRIVKVTLYPMQVNPVTREARFYDNIDVDIIANNSPGRNEITVPRRPSGEWAPLYRGYISNLDESALDDVDYNPGSYVIICRDNATSRQWADSLATWRQRLGFTVVVEARNDWTYSNLRSFLQEAYSNWDPPLEYACILGDHGTSGSFTVQSNITGNQWGDDYDHYFADLAGNDDFEEIAVGRISANSSGDFALVNNKIMTYERTPYMDDPSWFTRAFLYAGTGSNVSSNEILMLWAADMFRSYTGVSTPQVSTHGGSVSNQLIGNRLTEGVSFFLWRGTVVGEMQSSAATAMSSTPKLPVVLAITCGSGDFDGTGLNESWLFAGTATAPKGGICGIGTATFNTHVPYNNTVAGGLVYAIANLGVRHLGTALSAAKTELLRSFPGDATGARFAAWNNLMGDPGISMWTDVPVVMNVTYPSTVNVGTRRVRPQVIDASSGDPIADALVVIVKEDETFVKGFTDAGGFVDLPVTVDSPGNMTITVSKRNHKPFLADISCVNSAEMVTVSTYTVDDDNTGGTQGNNDHQLNPGETVDFAVTLRNFGNATTANNVTATMTCDNPDVTIVQGNSTFPNLTPGQQAAGNSAFRVQFAQNMRHFETAKLTIEVNSTTGTAYSTVELTMQAGSAVFVSSQISGGNGNNRLDPGEIVTFRATVRNEGGVAMDNVSATLISRYSLVSVMDGSGSFGNIAVGGTATSGATDFSLRANSVTYPGSMANLLLVLTTPGGFVDSVGFSLPVGVATVTDPSGPDPFGYVAYDNVDTEYEWSRTYDWTDISSTGTRLTHASADPGEQLPTGQTNSDVVELPFEFMFYGETYDSLTVCSNGWAAFGSQAHLDVFRNYPIPGQQAPEALLAVFWDDLKTSGAGDGVWFFHDETNHKFIVEWNAGGGYPSYSTTLDFQIVLLDPAFYPTEDGNGIVIFQYATAQSVNQDGSEAPGETIGIQAPRALIGLQYRFALQNAAGANGLGNTRAITITTDKRSATGIITGVVTDSETGDPLEGVVISLDGEVEQGVTDVTGHYTILDVQIGTYTLRASRFGFNDGTVTDFVIETDSTELADFSLNHPEIELSESSLIYNIPGSPSDQTFDIQNDGNGPLDFRITMEYEALDGERGNWSTVAREQVSQETGDAQILGCAFDGNRWVVSGGSGPTGSNYFYYYDLNGNYIGSAVQPTTTQFGYYDLAFDGQYVYGGTDGLQGIQGVNASGELRTTIPVTQVSPARCIAYDPELDRFWVSDYSTDIFCIDRDGNEIRRFPNNMDKTGLAWYSDDPDGYKLYVFHLVSGTGGTRISKVHPGTGAVLTVATISAQQGDRAGGCDISSDRNSMLTVFGGVFQNPQGDRLEMRQMKFHTEWLGVTPLISSVLPQSTRDITVSVNTDNLRDLTYHVNLYVHNNSLDSSLVLPLTLTRTLVADQPEPTIPAVYALHQNYPNPFNPSTQIKFDLIEAGLTTLKIFNILGQEVTAPINAEMMTPGQHVINVDMSGLPSGVYLYRVESGSFAETKKMVLMK
jgi:hypothetical protein